MACSFHLHIVASRFGLSQDDVQWQTHSVRGVKETVATPHPALGCHIQNSQETRPHPAVPNGYLHRQSRSRHAARRLLRVADDNTAATATWCGRRQLGRISCHSQTKPYKSSLFKLFPKYSFHFSIANSLFFLAVADLLSDSTQSPLCNVRQSLIFEDILRHTILIQRVGR